MDCPACQHQNDLSDKFCSECGARLALACPECKAELKAGAKFCSECGTKVSAPPPSPGGQTSETRSVADYTPKHLADKILQSRSALEGESKQVTVMFADVKDSMVIAARVGAETWHEILDQFFGILSNGVHRYEGTINQYTGDGIMALFGAPIAHEDHAQRACYAAIRMRDELKAFADRLRIEHGIDFAVRIGINSGDVVVGKIGDDLRMDYTAQGHTVGLAQRIEQLAGAGRVYISEHTHRIVAGFFTTTDLGASQITAIDEPIHIYEVESTSASRTRLEVAQTRGLTRFVGRTDEMQALHAALQRARDGYGQVVGVVGDPGLGKSRLCFEFVEQCKADGIRVVEGHCPAHGKNIPLIPILELYRDFFGISGQDTNEQARQKIAGGLVLLDPTMHDNLPVLFDFLGVPDPDQPALNLDSAARQQRLYIMLRQIYQSLAARGTATVLFVDDVHWIDAASDTFLAQIVELIGENSRVLLLLNFRPEYSAEWMRRGYYLQLPLVPLGANEIKELVVSLLGNDSSVAGLTERITQWTEGNPFYTEEVINELAETGHLAGHPGQYTLVTDVDKLKVPVNVRSVLAARIDRLPESAKQLLQAAAVIGREFKGSVLQVITALPPDEVSSAIDRLKSGDFIYESALHPEIEYTFKHPLTHEVAYASLLNSIQKSLHAATAEAIESTPGGKIDELSPLIAYHWDAAEDPAQAIMWHQKAAEWCGMTDVWGAMKHWRRVRDIAFELPPNSETTLLGARASSLMITYMWRLGATDEDLEDAFEKGKVFAENSGDQSLLSFLYGAYSACLGVNRGDAVSYLEYSSEAVRLAAAAQDSELHFAMSAYQSAALMAVGKYRDCCDLVARMRPDQVDDMYGASELGTSPKLLMYICFDASKAALGELADVEKNWSDTSTFDSLRQDMLIIRNNFRCLQLALYGKNAAVRNMLQAMVNYIEDAPTTVALVGYNVALGLVALLDEQYEVAVEHLSESIDVVDRTNCGVWWKYVAMALLATAQARLGNLDEAMRLAQEAVTVSRKHNFRAYAHPWISLAEISIQAKDDKTALETIEDLEAFTRKSDAKLYLPYVHELRGTFAKAFKSDWSAEKEFKQAQHLFTELGAPSQAERIAALL